MSNNNEINIKQLYNQTKKIMTLKTKFITTTKLYNILNDNSPYKIVDIRQESEGKPVISSENIKNEVTSFCGSCVSSLYSVQSTQITVNIHNCLSNQISKPNTRLVLIVLKDFIVENNLEVKKYIQLYQDFISDIYLCVDSVFYSFLSRFSFYTNNTTINVSNTSFPLCIIEDVLYIGNYIQARSPLLLNALHIKSAIGIISHDQNLVSQYGNEMISFFPVDEEKKEEVDFKEVHLQFEEYCLSKQSPVLLFCFTGKSLSLACCIYIIMMYKKVNLLGATAYIMSIIPGFKLSPWLYSQLQRVKV